MKSNDTMSSIAEQFDVALDDLIAANAENIPNPDKLQIGDQVIIPVPESDELPERDLIAGSGATRAGPARARYRGARLMLVIFPASTRNDASRCWLGAPGRTLRTSAW